MVGSLDDWVVHFGSDHCRSSREVMEEVCRPFILFHAVKAIADTLCVSWYPQPNLVQGKIRLDGCEKRLFPRRPDDGMLSTIDEKDELESPKKY